MRITACTDPGCRHDDNQDYYRAGRMSDDTHWIVLCDGMGGVAEGGQASEIATEYLKNCIEKKLPDLFSSESVKEFMIRSLKDCNRLIMSHNVGDEDMITMGTTAVMAIVRGNTAQIVHSGDSRAYLVTRSSIKLLTKDHSIVQELLDSGKITDEQAYTHPNKNIITSALGVDDEIKIDYNEQRLSKGDILLLCTDGLSNMIRHNDIASLIRENDFFRSADVLVKKAVDAGGYDNITAVVLEA